MTQKNNTNHSDNNILSSTFLNDTAVSPVAVNASLTKSSRKRYALNNNFSRTQLDLGKFNQSKLSNLYQSYYEQQQRGQVICLAYIDMQNDKQIKITNQALQLFKKYQKNSISFVGNFGKKGSGKSFWYDKILNLSDVQGCQYSKIQDVPGLYIWTVPFVKNNLRIFLVDYSNSRQGDNLSGQDQKLLDLQLLLAEVIVLLPQPQDKKQKVSDLAYTSFNSGMNRLSDKGSKTNKQSGYWPNYFYNLYRSVKGVSPQTDKLSYLFSDYNYSIIHDALNSKYKQSVSQLSMMESSLVKGQSSHKFLNEKYVKRSSLVFKDIYKKLNGKKYQNLQYTGEIIPYILRHAAKNLNQSKNLKVDKMFYDIKKDIYQKKLEAGKFVYNLNYDTLKDKNQQDTNTTNKSRSKSKSKTDNLKSSKNQSLKQSKKTTSQKNQNKQKTQNMRLNQSLNRQSISGKNSQAQIQPIKPKPQSLDDILNIFRRTNQNVLNNYDETKYDSNLHKQYEKKLLQYGDIKQKEVLDYNKQQTYRVLSSSLPTFAYPQDKKIKLEDKTLTDKSNASDPTEQIDYNSILSYLRQLKTDGLPLDHDRCTPVSQKLKDVSAYTSKRKFFHVWETQAFYKQRKLQMAVQDKKKQLGGLKGRRNQLILLNSHQGNKATQLLDEHNRSTDKIQKLKTEVDLGRKKNGNQISDEQYKKALQDHKKNLQNALKQNERKMKQLNKNIAEDPRSQILQQKIDDKKTLQLQLQAGISNLVTSRINTSHSILSSRKSQIRKIGDHGIKKSQFNKSMTK